MGVSRDSLERVRSALNLLDLIRETVPSLRQVGNRWRGLCPFHNERTPSFYVMPEKGLWHCFGACNEGGDVFKFLMRLEGIPFPEALRLCARRAGVTLENDRGDDGDNRAGREREQLLELLESAAVFYRDALRKSADAEVARRYAASRGLTPETVDRFRLGYAPGRDGFLDVQLRQGTPIELLTKAGLAVRSDKTGRYHDPLLGRLVFPVTDPYGQVVAFGGRVLEEGPNTGPKYLNSPETPVYTKGRHLYGLFAGRTALRARGQALLVEGYMDVIGCHQAGLDVAVAPLGTAFTREQAGLLRRYVQEAVLLFDPDEAGRRASWRTAEILVQSDLFVRVAQVPGGLDPDEYVLAEGPAALEGVLKGSSDIVDFWLDHLAAEPGDWNDLHVRLRRAEELLRFLAGVTNELWRQEWLKRAAARLGLGEDALVRELARRGAAVKPAVPAPIKPTPSAVVPRPAPARSAGPSVRSAEEEYLQLLAAHGELSAGGVRPDHFADERCRRVFEAWSADRAAGRQADWGVLLHALDPDTARWLSSLLMEAKLFENPGEALTRAAARLERQTAVRERRALEAEVLGMLDGRAPRDDEKILRYQALTRALKSGDRPE
jgi:DNA primase